MAPGEGMTESGVGIVGDLSNRRSDTVAGGERSASLDADDTAASRVAAEGAATSDDEIRAPTAHSRAGTVEIATGDLSTCRPAEMARCKRTARQMNGACHGSAATYAAARMRRYRCRSRMTAERAAGNAAQVSAARISSAEGAGNGMRDANN